MVWIFGISLLNFSPLVLEMFQYPFMQRALVTGLLIGIIGPLIGSFLVHREMALIGEALAHTAFAGVAVGLFLTTAYEWAGSPLVWALIVAIIASLGMQYISVHTEVTGDIPIAIMLTGGFALGIAIISHGVGFTTTVGNYLFGSILTVTPESIRLMALLSVVVVGVVVVTHKQLLFITFDREAAKLARINVGLYDGLLVVLTAVVVVASMQILGAILVAAMLVVPVAAAMQVTNSFKSSVYTSILIGEMSALLGIILSFVYDLATGAMIVLVAIALYLISLPVGAWHRSR